jgi:hypothetical protein
MAGIDRNAPDPEQDPDEDTPDLEAEEGDEAEAQPEPDRDRLAEAQATITRQAQELALFRRQASEAAATGEAEGSDPSLSALEADSWTLAEQVYGGDAIEAYRSAAELLDQAVTPADHLAAFEAYHAIRSGEAPAQAGESGQKPSRAEAITPRVDTNRSDLGPDPDIEQKLSEARKGKSLADFTNAAAVAMGFGRAK